MSHDKQTTLTQNANEIKPKEVPNDDITKVKNQTLLISAGQFIHENKNKVEESYKILSLIGKGSYGSIYKVQHRSSKLFRAMKIIKKSCLAMQDDDQKFLKEIEILIGTDHPNIIKIFEYYVDSINFIIITEFIGGGDLYNTISKFKKFGEETAATIMYQVLSAICYLHSKNIVHRDIKPENILVENWGGNKKNEKFERGDISLKLIDFGTSNYFTNKHKLSLKIGSPYYIAPEVIKNEYNEKCDIWSCGVLMYILLSGKPPFYGNSVEEIMDNVKKGKYQINEKIFPNISSNAKELIEKLLTYDYKKRISAEDALRTDWIVAHLNASNKIDLKDTDQILNNIRTFGAKEKLQHATLAFIVHFVGASEEVKTLKKIFQAMDTSGDGRLTYDELKSGFEKIFGKNLSEVELEKIISDIDQDRNGYIEYEEFLRIALNKNTLLSQKNLKLAFDNFDENKDGTLSKNEIKKILGTASNTYFDEVIKRIDQDGNGEISFEEFSDMMRIIVEDKIPPSKKVTGLKMDYDKETTHKEQDEYVDKKEKSCK